MHGDETTLWPVEPQKPMRKRTICALLGEVYRLIEGGRGEDALPLVNQAHDCAKRMDRRLREYAAAAGNPSWVERGFWEQSAPTSERGAKLQAVGPASGKDIKESGKMMKLYGPGKARVGGVTYDQKCWMDDRCVHCDGYGILIQSDRQPEWVNRLAKFDVRATKEWVRDCNFCHASGVAGGKR